MKKIFILGMLATSTFYFAFADTYGYDDSNDIVHTATPVETIYGYDATYYITVPNPLPALTDYTISLGTKGVSTMNIQNVNGISVTISDGLGHSISSPNTTTGDVSATFTAPSSGSVTFSSSGDLTGASCNTWGDGSCKVPPFGSAQTVPVSSASVNLNISGMFNSFLSFFHIIDKVEASQ